jgi:hypothetical protein
VDSSGNIYVTGHSTAAWNGPGDTPPINAYTGGADIVVVKLDSSGAYQWHTFYGSSDTDVSYNIAADSSGNVFVTGESRATWNGSGDTPPINAFTGGSDIVVVKLNGSGGYQWHTFHGSSGSDRGYGIAADNSGNVYVTGYSNNGWGFPINAHAGNWDIVVVKLNGAGGYQWHTFHGSGNYDGGYGIAADNSGNVYAAGYSGATWNGPGDTPPLNAHAGNYDIVVVELNSAGAYQWHTFHGSSSSDIGNGIAADPSGNVYVAGYSGATWGTPINGHAGGDDIVVVELNGGGAYQWHTFHGSSTYDYGNGIDVDTACNVYVAGYSDATWGTPLNAYSGGADIVAAGLNGSGDLQWHTFYGSSGHDFGDGIAADNSGNVYAAGYSGATWGSPINAHAGGDDIAVVNTAYTTPTPTPTATPTETPGP